VRTSISIHYKNAITRNNTPLSSYSQKMTFKQKVDFIQKPKIGHILQRQTRKWTKYKKDKLWITMGTSG